MKFKKIFCRLFGHKWTPFIETPEGTMYVSTCRRCEERKYKILTEFGKFEWKE